MARCQSSNHVPSESAVSSPQLMHGELTSNSMVLNSGFDYDFVEKLDSKYECSICLLALRNPIQTKCGHRFCYDCIMGCINGCNKECPIDKKPLSELDFFQDSCIEREILQLKVKCPNSTLGCKCQIDLRYIEDHMHACIYQPVLCTNECSVTVLQNELADHLMNHCLHRLTKCSSCHSTFTFNQEQLHIMECPLVNVSCDLCGEYIQRANLIEHKNDFCLHAVVSCSFREHGCQFQSSRSEMRKHVQTEVEYHIQLLSAAYKKINTLVLDLYRNMGQLASGTFTRQPSLRSQISQSSMFDGQNSPQPSERPFDGSMIGAVGQSNTFNLFNFTPSGNKRNDPENELKMNQLSLLDVHKREDSASTITDSKDLKGPSAKDQQETLLKRMSDKLVGMDQRIMEEMIRIDGLIRKIELIEVNLRNLSYEMHGKFCQGTFVWKLPNFSEIAGNMEKKNKIFYSPPFYTSQFGYKFCLRTNATTVNGESFLTLYLHLMQSENDVFLSFPFQGKIVLYILDCKESGTKNHFIENMDVAGNIDAFKKPDTKTINVKGYGYKEFISLDQIFNPTPGTKYLKNNVLYIKAVVMPK